MKTSSPNVNLPPPPTRIESSTGYAPIFAAQGAISTLHFWVHPDLPEVRRHAAVLGWEAKGFHNLTVTWQTLHWTADEWKTVHEVSSSDVPCPVVNGTFYLAGCSPGTEVEFAIHVGIACHAAEDTAGARDVGDLWLNNDGVNYRQVTK